MWAQLITVRLKPNKVEEFPKIVEQLQAMEKPGSGLLRSTAMQDQSDPCRAFMLVVFKDEESARARENDPSREGPLQRIRAMMAEAYEGAPEFIDLDVVRELSN